MGRPSGHFRIAMTHVDLPNETNGGVAHQVHGLANALASRGHDVTVFTFSPAFSDCRYQVHQFGAPRLPRRLAGFSLARRLAQADFSSFDLLHTHGDNFLASRVHPQVRTMHGSGLDEAMTATSLRRRLLQTCVYLLERRGARIADVCVGVSNATRARFPSIRLVIPCGVDIARFRKPADEPRSEDPTVLFVGTRDGRKRGQFLADRFSAEVRRTLTSAELWAVSDAPLQGAGVVNFGRVPFETLRTLYRRAWVFCLPSTYEGFGVPYIEAMASGTPVVASPNPGAREVLGDGAFGVLAGDDDLGGRVTALLQNPALRSNLADKGLHRAQDFSWESVAARYETVYRQVAR
jgi:phosphatidylinositol alpha-mannosyltransferase